MKRFLLSALVAMSSMPLHATIVVTGITDPQILVNTLAGNGVIISNVAFNTDGAEAGVFYEGHAAGLEFDSGVVLTTGTLDCIAGPNNQYGCSDGVGATFSSLSFDVVSSTNRLYVQYQFASEEYVDFFGYSEWSDTFKLLLTAPAGTPSNIAVLPMPGAGEVAIHNINPHVNAGFFINNSASIIDLQYDGFTVALTAVANVVAGQTYHFEFQIEDSLDFLYDSALFIKAGSISALPAGAIQPVEVPEPTSIVLAGIALAALTTRWNK